MIGTLVEKYGDFSLDNLTEDEIALYWKIHLPPQLVVRNAAIEIGPNQSVKVEVLKVDARKVSAWWPLHAEPKVNVAYEAVTN